MNMHNTYSPMRFLQPSYNSNVNFNTSFTNMGNVSQKMTPGQDNSLYQTYPYKYSDYAYYDYPTTQANPYSQNIYDTYGQADVLDTHPNNALSLMWSNEVRGLNKRIPSDDFLPPTQTLNIKRLSSAVSNEQDTPKKVKNDSGDFFVKRNRLCHSKSNKTLKKFPIKAWGYK